MKKQSFYAIMLTLLMSMVGAKTFAHDIAVANSDGKTIYYNWIKSNTELAVTYGSYNYSYWTNEYSGDVVIPESVEYNGNTYSVTSIYGDAFRDCTSLTSVVIPKSVVSIGGYAFYGCSSLTSITIPNSISSIGGYAFDGSPWYNNQPDGVVYAGKVAYKYKGTMPINSEIELVNGTLSISPYAFYDCSGLASIKIPSSVLSIGTYAFQNCSSMTSISIPNGITAINEGTFKGCGRLTTITIPSSISSIGGYAFNNCTGLTSISIPNCVTSIGNYAFNNCSGLTSITIPNSVTSIGDYAFGGCNGLISIELNCENIGSWFSGFTSIKTIRIGDKVTTIGQLAFSNCSGLTSITIPNSVTSIGQSAFSNCSGLTSITIPNSVTSIGQSTFYNCKGLTSIAIPNSVTSIGNEAFQYCSGLTTVVSEIKNPYVISTNVFYSDTYSKATLIVPENTKTSYQASTGWNNFKNIVESGGGGVIGNMINVDGINYLIGENNTVSLTFNSNISYSGDFEIPSQVTYNGINYSVISIGQSAFSNCTGLTSIAIPESIETISNNAFQNCSGLTSLIIPTSVKFIGQQAFYNCSSLTSIEIPESIETISDYAFYYCSGLTTLIIPTGLTSIGNYAFYNCSGLTSIIIPNSVMSIGQSAFYGCNGITSILIPNSVTTIGSQAFYCSNLNSVIIGSGVTSVGYDAFNTANLKKTIWLTNTPPSGYSYASGSINYVSNDQFSFSNQIKYQFLSSYFDVDGIRYVPVSPSERTCDAIDCVYNESVANTKIGPTVVYKGVTMNVKDIKPYLAYNNKYIKTLTIDNNGELADYTFTDCSNLQTVIYGERVNRIGKGAFSGCKNLTSLTTSEKTTISNVLCISKNVNMIDDYAFKGCEAIKNVLFMDSDAELKLGANYIVDYYYNETGTPLFSDCPLDSVYIGRNIDYNSTKQYGYSPFYRNTSLRAVKITDRETEISDNEFYGCTNLQRVVIGDGVTAIGKWAFSGCQSLKYFAFGSQVATIGQEAFSDCSTVIEISSKAATPPVCGTQALDDINKWECKLYVPDGCMAVYQEADQWKDFFFTEEGEGTAGQESGAHSDNNQKCETPTITIDGNKIKFDCKTNGVIFHYTLTSAEAKSDITNNDIEVKNNYTISVYASKEGYVDSEVAREEFQIEALGKRGDLTGDGVVNVADHVELTKIIMEQK